LNGGLILAGHFYMFEIHQNPVPPLWFRLSSVHIIIISGSTMSRQIRLPELDIVLEIRSPHRPGSLGRIFTAIGSEGGLIGDITTKFVGKTHSLREVTVSVYDTAHLEEIRRALSEKTHSEIIGIRDPVLERHKGGKLHSGRKRDLATVTDLRYIYTPGVARICTMIAGKPAMAREYTGIAGSVGIFTNGTRVLGLGDIGPVAAMPVMEGKAVIYDQFVGISAVPILVDTRDPHEFIETVVRIAPTFGGIHLEDIRMPDCFLIEEELIRRLRQPVMHDDQHGTATVTLAAVISALRQTGLKKSSRPVVGQIGLGAAGYGIGKLLIEYGMRVIASDPDESACRRFLAVGGKIATLPELMKKSSIVIAATGKVGLLKPGMIRKGQIILALSNPVPEIYPEEALAAGAALAADGASINNALAYPGLFKAALELNAPAITPPMKIAAASVISSLADNDELVPSPFHPDVHTGIIAAIRRLPRKSIRD
jgi:malate dehydrogenase (oxaloacetate-decarboxylating)